MRSCMFVVELLYLWAGDDGIWHWARGLLVFHELKMRPFSTNCFPRIFEKRAEP
jgi:hypothetical protein